LPPESCVSIAKRSKQPRLASVKPVRAFCANGFFSMELVR
jgi:hypothetical protein